MKKITLLLIGAVVLWPIIADSAPVQPARRNQPAQFRKTETNRERFQPDGKAGERMAAIHFYKLIEFLDLTTEEANKLAPAIQARDNARKDYFQARQKTLDNLEELVKKGASANELKKAMAEISTLDEKHLTKEKELTGKVLELLPPEKQAKYYLFNRHFAGEVRQGLYNMAQRRMQKNPQFREQMKKR